jgi:hypothetical protein
VAETKTTEPPEVTDERIDPDLFRAIHNALRDPARYAERQRLLGAGYVEPQPQHEARAVALAIAPFLAKPPEPKARLYGLTADEWMHLAAEGQDSEVGPCCGDIGELREYLNAMATCQGAGEDWVMRQPVLDAYEAASADGEHGLSDRSTFPLLHRVLDGIKAAGDE